MMKSITFDSHTIIIVKKISSMFFYIRINQSIILRIQKLSPKINRKETKKKTTKTKFFKRETRRREGKDDKISHKIEGQVRPEFEARSEFASAFNEAVLYRRWQHRGEVENPKVARAR